MKKKFNITGLCYPAQHYMMDVSEKLRQVMIMVEDGEYFIINRPRQYGKTTMLHLLGEALSGKEDYFPIEMNFQGIDEQWLQSDGLFAKMFANQLLRVLKSTAPNIFGSLKEVLSAVGDMDALSDAITELVHKTNKKIVLIIDEVDASSNHKPFLNFLGMLRTKYLARHKTYHATFYSIVLAGVHDIKSLKFKIRDDQDSKYNSPWNIAADFKVDMSFSAEEIAPMLEEYSKSEGVTMDIPGIAEKIFFYTSGYPFLVSKLCKIIAEELLPEKQDFDESKEWGMDDVEMAVQFLLKDINTNFESLIKNLENDKELYDLVHRVLIDGESIPYTPYEPMISYGRMYGVFKINGSLKVHNRIYEQCIYDYMTTKSIVNIPDIKNYAGQFTVKNNILDIEAVLLKFQQFMKEQNTSKNRAFLEEQGRLVFLSFFSPILNGQGYSFKEVQVSLEKRLDIIVTYFQHRYIIELKKWYGEKAHEEGLNQLAEYLEIHGVKKGYLVIFDFRKTKEWENKTIHHKGKEIFAVWV